jgi:hypothetical protein
MNHTSHVASARFASRHASIIRQLAASMLALAAALLVIASLWPGKAFAQTDVPPPAPSSLIVKLVTGLTVDQQAAVITRNGGVEISTVPALRLHVVEVGADQLQESLARYQADAQVARVEVNAVRQSNTVPSDPMYDQQWALPKIGWDLAFGSTNPVANVVVAVLDTGIDGTHPDLAGNVIAGTSVLDASNGLTDPSGHGTMVAGTVAARTNTVPPEGIAGVGYAGVRLMPVTVLNADGLGQDSDIISGVVWAVDHGADVILMAFSNPGFSASLQEAIDYAWSSNVVLVAATGNDGVNAPTYPAGDRGVIGVSATDQNDQLAPFSNYGASVFLAAPGTSILTTDVGASYVAINGTSSSAAIVAGAAAQMMAVDPTLSNGIVVGRLARTADPAGTQEATGNGRVNLARALLDTGTDFVQPAGAGGTGGPFVGPYRAAARNSTLTFAGTGTGSVTITPSSGTVNAPTSCGGTGAAAASQTVTSTCAPNITTSDNGATITFSATAGTNSFFAGWSGQSNLSSSTCSGTTNPCSAVLTGNAQLTVTFSGKSNQTISVTTPAPASAAYNATFNVAATASSGLAVAITTTGGCTGSGSGSAAVTMTSPTTACVVHYNQAGNATFNAAPEVTSTTTATKANQAITVTQPAPATATFGTGFVVKATASSGLNVAVAGSGACSGSGTDTGTGVSITMASGTGTCTVTYSQTGDTNYNAAPNAVESTAAQKASQTINFGALSDKTFGDPDFSVVATATSGLPVTFGAAGNCTVSGNLVHIAGAGSCTVTASQVGDANYSAAASVPRGFSIAKAPAITAVSCPVSVTYTGAAQTPCSATVTGAGGLSFTPTPNYANNVNAGAATASYTYTGDANHTGSSDSKNFTIDKANTTTTVTSSLNPATADDSVTFTATLAPLSAAGTVTFVIDGNAGTSVAVNAGIATLTTSLTVAKAYTVAATYSGDPNFNGSSGTLAGGQVVTAGAPAQLSVGVQPTNTQAGQAITPAVTVRILDAEGNQTTSTASVTLAASGPGAFTMASTSIVAAVAGVAMFDNLHINVAGTYMIGAASTGLATATSDGFDVTPGPATTFAFDVPASVIAGDMFTFTLTAKDQFANTATGYTGVVHFTSTDPQAALPSDTQFVAGDHGVKTLTLATALKTAGNQTISAKDTVAVTPTITGTSATITVNPGNATLLLVTAPAAAVAGEAFDVTVEARDGFGNTATGYAGSVKFTITDPKADPVSNYAFVPGADHGVHTFGVTLRKAGQWTVQATDINASAITGISGTISVQPGPPAKLAFQKQPGGTVVAVAIPDFEVAIEDADDNVVDSSNAAITIAIGNNPRGAVLTGTLAVNAINGVATFGGLGLNRAAQGYTLVGSSGSLTDAISEPFDVGKGTASLALGNLAQTFDGSPKSASVTTTPAGLSGVSVTYNGSGTAPTNAGSYAVLASLLNDDYAAPDATGTLVIAKASSATTVTFEPGPYTYRGSAFTATATVTGAGGLSASVAVVYTGDCTNVTPGGCTATATFAGDTNHEGSSDTKSVTITKADSTTTVTFESGPYVYRGTAFTATASVTGIGGLGSMLPIVYSGDCTSVTNANGCTATATFAGDQNHNGSNGAKSITITKASSTTVVTFETAPYTYRASAFTATAKVTGIGGLDSSVPVTYSGDCTNVTSPDGCTATATYGGDQNHDGSNDAKSITIAKAGSTTLVTFENGPYTYRAAAFTATANVTGIGGLSSLVAVAYTGDCANVTVANGCTATATFAGDQNHNGSNDAKSITITKAGSTTVVTFEAGPYVYRATAFAATAVVTGIGGLNSPVAVSYVGDCINVTVANGCTGTATFAGDGNHQTSSDSKSITIARASSATLVTCTSSVTYTGGPQTPCTANVTGVGGLSQSLAVIYANNVNAGMAGASANYAGDGNHNGSSDSKSFMINKASTTTTLASAPNPINVGQSVTFTATMSASAAPGTVTFKDGAYTLGSGTIAGGVATLSTAALAAGPHTVTAEYGETANYFGSVSNSVTENVNSAPSNVSITLSASSINENDTVTLSGSFFDAYDYAIGNHTITINWGDGSANTMVSVPGGSGTFGIPAGVTHQYLDDNPTNTASDSYTIAVTVTDSGGLSALATQQIGVNNVAPAITSVVGPVDPIALGGAANVSVNFTDVGSQDTHTCTFHWNDGATDTVVAAAGTGNGSCSATHTYAISNVYPVDVTVSDDDLGSAVSSLRYVVIYDANNGFVTGGGWIMSPAGAFAANPSLTGKANFGFVSKYQKGANVPTGNTEFQFQAGNFNFKSTVYEWLVIAGAKAQYKGSGTINGAGDYGFMLTAIDGSASGGGGVDKFRLKVWDKTTSAVIYDNQTGAADSADPTTALGGGSIVIHK